MRVGLIVLATAIACGDNLAGPVVDAADAAPDAAIDATPGVADLTLIAEEMDETLLITLDTFSALDCEVVEMCVGDTGARRLLRFDTVTANLGTADLVVGTPPPDGVSEPPFTWSPCHGHHHVAGYANYELLDASGAILSGHKQAFCLRDSQQARPGSPSSGYTCAMQGLSAGWADVYNRALPCQWIDVTDVPPGTYTLRVAINPLGALAESDATNNEYRREVSL